MGPVMVRLSAARAGVGSNIPHARPAEQHEAARGSTSGARERTWRNTPSQREGVRRDAHDESGSQTIEFALVVPAALLLLVLILHAGVMAADLVAAQGLAREAARAAAVSDDAAARAVTHSAAGRRPVEVTFAPTSNARVPGDLVTARLRLRSRAFAAFGVPVWLPAQATMRVESG
jgi:Flp pilus assembly protein TadG